jgi:hypothetical protein
MLQENYYRTINFTEISDKDELYSETIESDVELKPHQLALINKCIERESKYIHLEHDPYIHDKYMNMKTDMGIIADKVGSGKTFVILGIISSNTLPAETYQLNTSYGFGHVLLEHKRENALLDKDINVIVIPHTLTKQWSTSISTFSSNLKYYLVNRHACLDNLERVVREGEHKILLVTGNFYRQVRAILYLNKIRVSRVFYDEADSTVIPSANYMFCRFMWFVTASYKNLIFPFQKIFYDRHNLANSHVVSNGITNNSFVKSLFINLWKTMGENEIRSLDKIILKNADAFVDASFKLPSIHQHIIPCKVPIELYVLSGVVNQDIVRCLNAGDLETAKQFVVEDNLCTEDNLIDKVLQELNNNKNNLNVKLESLTRMFFTTEERRENQRSKLIAQVSEIETKIQMIKERLTDGSLCIICYNAPTTSNKTISKCCNNTYCFQCITRWLNVNSTCPLCKHNCNIATDFYVVHQEDQKRQSGLNDLLNSLPGFDEQSKECDKLMNLMRILHNRKSYSKFLIFSDFEQSFIHMYEYLNRCNISYAHVKGNGASNNIEKYKNGTIDALLVNSKNYASGLNLENTTDVILFHKYETQIEKQIIGRAQRPGRRGNLNVWYLLNETEI